jgi:hypothetical protein
MANPNITRRDFLKSSSQVMAGAALTGAIAAPSYTAENNTIKIALIGCGGRGTGAAANALSTAGPTKLVALADVFEHRVASSHEALLTSRLRKGAFLAKSVQNSAILGERECRGQESIWLREQLRYCSHRINGACALAVARGRYEQVPDRVAPRRWNRGRCSAGRPHCAEPTAVRCGIRYR